MSEKALIPVEQKTVLFYEDELTAVRAEDGRVYVSMNQMCAALGLDAQAQRRRIGRHLVLSKGLQGVANLATPGGTQFGYVLRVDLVPLWLSGVRVSAVREEIKPKLTQFQEEAATVLWEAFQEGRLTTDNTFDELLNIHENTPEVQAFKMLQGMLQLARNQIIIRDQLQNPEERLEGLEAAIAQPDSMVTQDQASQISQAVKTVAILQGKQTKRNEFGAVYGELYRKFGITSYKMLPAARFEEAMSFLNEWRESLGSESF